VSAVGVLDVTVLGAGDAFASRGWFQSGYVIEGGGTVVLLEAGPCILAALKRCEIAPADIDYILISHLHGDHFAGLPFLMLEYLYESPRRRILTIAGPRHLEQRTRAMFKSMYSHMDTAPIERKLRWVVLEPGCDVRLGPMRVASVRTPHTHPDVSLALRMRLAGKSVAFSGDSGWTEDLVELSAGADLFLCECTYYGSEHLEFHLNYPWLVKNRHRFTARRMVLTHLGRDVIDHRHEIDMETAIDLMKISV
jgi:ribonuclease BN (tRNA processing enzyme)